MYRETCVQFPHTRCIKKNLQTTLYSSQVTRQASHDVNKTFLSIIGILFSRPWFAIWRENEKNGMIDMKIRGRAFDGDTALETQNTKNE